MFNKIRIFTAVLVLILGIFTSGCKPADKPEKNENGKKLKVAFVYVGPVEDAGWTYTHDMGRQELEKAYDFVETRYYESITGKSNPEKVFEILAGENYDVIIGTSFGYLEPMLKVAKKNPQTVFLHCSGNKTASNLGVFHGRMYEARYLTGLIAGSMTKSNKIGYVAAYKVPETVRGVNAFTLGVKKVNPKATVYVYWTRTWYGPAKERLGADKLLAMGCDILAQHQDTPAVQQAAQSKGKYGIGFHNDMSQFAPESCLVSAVWNWGDYYKKAIKEVEEKTWQPSSYWGGIEDGIVDISKMSDKIPKDVRNMVMKSRQKIIDGELKVFSGPIKDNKGSIIVPKGKSLDDKAMLNMMFFVNGVVQVGDKK